ncbi:MAG: MerR family transcriptional regulator [Bacteroidota bacterium]
MVNGQTKNEIFLLPMKIGVLSKSTGISRDAVRLYEKLGLLKNISRPYEYNNYKEYGEENVQRILMIKQMQSFGMTLKECKEIFDAMENNTLDEHSGKKILITKIEQIDVKIRELKETKAALLAGINSCSERRGEIQNLINS